MKPSVLRLLLVATLLTAQLGTVGVFAIEASRRTVDELEANARTTLVTLADTVAERTKRFLGTVQSALQASATMIGSGTLDTYDDAALVQLFRAQLGADERLAALYFGRTDGTYLSVTREAGGKFRTHHAGKPATTQPGETGEAGWRSGLIDPVDAYDPRQESWYCMADSSSGIVWTDPYLFTSSGRPGISAAVAVADASGREVGVLGLDVDLRTLSGFIGHVPGTERGTAVLLDAGHHIVAASRSPWLREWRPRQALPRLGERDAGPLPALLELLEEALASPRREAVIGRLDIDGEAHLGLVLPFRPDGVSTPWSLLAQMPVDDYAGAVGRYFAGRVWQLLGALLVLSLAAMAAILRVTAPVVRIHRDATVDRLTGALLRGEFERRVALMMNERRAARHDERLIVAALDLDGFKQINDTHGHGAGDAVLAEFVRRLQSCLRTGDLLGRSGGDEFLLALRLSGSADPRATLERLREVAVGEPVAGAVGSYRVGVTVGVARHASGETLAALLTRADRTLIDGKAFEKNRVYVALEEDTLEASGSIAAAA